MGKFNKITQFLAGAGLTSAFLYPRLKAYEERSERETLRLIETHA